MSDTGSARSRLSSNALTKLLDWRAFLSMMAVLCGLALVASHFLDVPLLPTFVVLVASVLVNGFVATLEDDLPGGFDNPDGTETPRYAQRIVRITRWILAILLCAFAFAFSVGGLREDVRAPVSLVVGVSSACVLLALALLRRSRPILWLALLTAFAGIGAATLLRQ